MRKIAFILAACFSLLSFSLAQGQDQPITMGIVPPEPADLQLVRVARDLRYPTYVASAFDGTGRLFITEREGKIWVVENGERLETPFLDVSNLLYEDTFEEGAAFGLLGMVFHPNYEQNGEFFINYDGLLGASYLVRYRVSADNPNVADPNSAEIVFIIEQTRELEVHKGNIPIFGPDGYLYFAIGDGGYFEQFMIDPYNNAQNVHNLKGKILRIDVDSAHPYAIPPDNPFGNEVWQYGLRNPWRFSFDRATGDLYIGDVGFHDREEINFLPAGESGQNFGWAYYEGSIPSPRNTPELRTEQFAPITVPQDPVMPIFEYTHDDGCSVTGGYVYRGTTIPALQGVYIFGDFCFGNIWGAYRDVDGAWQTTQLFQVPANIVSFGEDEEGELYVVDYGGSVYMLRQTPPR